MIELLVLAVFLAVAISFVCSVSEATLLSLSPAHIAAMAEKKPVIADQWRELKANIDRPISVILVINTCANSMGAVIAGSQFDQLTQGNESALLIFGIVFTWLILQFGEIGPKTLGVRYAQRIAVLIGPALWFLVGILRPVLVGVRWMNRPFEGRATEQSRGAQVVAELRALARDARLNKQIGGTQEEIIVGASKFNTMLVRDIMVPDDDIIMLSTRDKLGDALITAHLHAHTRFPVAEDPGNPQTIIGYVNFKELVFLAKTHPHNPNLREITRPLGSLDPQLPVAEALRRMVAGHAHLSLVRDAGGTIVGMITMEDIFEELVGDIEDEFDRLPRHVTPSGQQWVVGGGITLGRLREATGITTLAQGQPANMQLADWLDELGGDEHHRGGGVLRVGEAQFLIRKVRRHRVMEALFDPKSAIVLSSATITAPARRTTGSSST